MAPSAETPVQATSIGSIGNVCREKRSGEESLGGRDFRLAQATVHQLHFDAEGGAIISQFGIGFESQLTCKSAKVDILPLNGLDHDFAKGLPRQLVLQH